MMPSAHVFALGCLLAGCLNIAGVTWPVATAESREGSVLGRPSGLSSDTDKVTLPTVPLVDQDSQAQRMDRLLEGRTVVIDFVYTSCKTSCSILSAIMGQVEQRVRDRLGDHLLLVSLTVDPAHDTPAQLKEYAAKFSATPHWHWLTGSMPDVKQALRAFGIPVVGRPEDHAPVILAGNVRTGKWQRWIGIPDPDVVARAAQNLSSE
ncbi:MAG: SCO family protein [Nitrospira sp.]|nr:SCO family protein [Nitrospira sp.]